MAPKGLERVLALVADLSRALEMLHEGALEEVPQRRVAFEAVLPHDKDGTLVPKPIPRVATPPVIRHGGSHLGSLGKAAQRREDVQCINNSMLQVVDEDAIIALRASQKLRNDLISRVPKSSETEEMNSNAVMILTGVARVSELFLSFCGYAYSSSVRWRRCANLFFCILGLGAGLIPLLFSSRKVEILSLTIHGFSCACVCAVTFLATFLQKRCPVLGFALIDLSLRDAGAYTFWTLSWKDFLLGGSVLSCSLSYVFAALRSIEPPWLYILIPSMLLLQMVLGLHLLMLVRICRGLVFLLDAFSELLYESEELGVIWERWTFLGALTRATNTRLQASLLVLQLILVVLPLHISFLLATWSSTWLHVSLVVGNLSMIFQVEYVFLQAANLASYHAETKQHVLGMHPSGDVERNLLYLQTSVLHTNLCLSVLSERLTFTFLAREAYILTGVGGFLYSFF